MLETRSSKKMYSKSEEVSVQVAENGGIDGETAKKILVEAGVKRTKRRKAPKSNENQEILQKNA
jgi:hypothetical protein